MASCLRHWPASRARRTPLSGGTARSKSRRIDRRSGPKTGRPGAYISESHAPPSYPPSAHPALACSLIGRDVPVNQGWGPPHGPRGADEMDGSCGRERNPCVVGRSGLEEVEGVMRKGGVHGSKHRRTLEGMSVSGSPGSSPRPCPSGLSRAMDKREGQVQLTCCSKTADQQIRAPSPL